MPSAVIAAIGAGGKSTALRCLAEKYASERVLLTTTTHIRIPPPGQHRLLIDPDGEELQSALSEPGIVYAGSSGETGKLGALPEHLLNEAGKTADLILYEADGAHCLPLKLHEKYEPVLLPATDQCLVVAGLSALGRSVSEVVHRWQLNTDWSRDQIADGEILMECVLDAVRAGSLHPLQYKVLLNQADTLSDPGKGEVLARMVRRYGLDCRVCSLQKDHDFLSDWLLGQSVR